MTDDGPAPLRTGVLRDYPLRLWAQQQEHTAELLRELTLVVLGAQSGETVHEAPRQLVELAQSFTRAYGGLIEQVNSPRQAAWDAGEDRIDSQIPLLPELPQMLDQVFGVLRTVDDYCRSGDMLALARPPELVALAEWTDRELRRQLAGEEPEPWPGPF